jgi:hypothetical protein
MTITRRLTTEDIPAIRKLHNLRANKTGSMTWDIESSISAFRPITKSFFEYRIYGQFDGEDLICTMGCNLWKNKPKMTVHTLLTNPNYPSVIFGKSVHKLMTQECESIGYYDQYSARNSRWIDIRKKRNHWYEWAKSDSVISRYELTELGRVPANTKPDNVEWWKAMCAMTSPYETSILCFSLKEPFREPV